MHLCGQVGPYCATPTTSHLTRGYKKPPLAWLTMASTRSINLAFHTLVSSQLTTETQSPEGDLVRIELPSTRPNRR